MVSPLYLQRCSLATFLQFWTLLRFSALARPFVLRSGLEALPDDDLAPVGLLDVGAALNEPGLSEVPLLQPLSPVATMLSSGKVVKEFAKPLAAEVPLAQPRALLTAARLRAPPSRHTRCRDVRQEVVIESGLQGHADVFSEGRTASSWSPMSASNFVLPSAEQVAVFAVRTGQAAMLAQPKFTVSDPSILGVQLAEKQNEPGMATDTDGAPSVFLSKHFCKRSGFATVTIELPLQINEGAPSQNPLCPGTPAPVVFSYQKACAIPSHTFGTFMKALTAELPTHDKLHALAHRAEPEKPWSGIIPSGGARAVLLCVLILGLCIVLYEFGTYWFSNQIKQMIIDMGPVMFGCEVTFEHCNLSVSPLRMTYTMRNLHFANPPGDYQNAYFMSIEEVKVWFNLYQIITTCGRVVEIRQLVARHIKANVEVDGYVFGQSNLSKVMTQMEKNNKEWLDNLQRIKDTHGIDAAKMWDSFEAWLRRVADRVTLKEVFMEGIGYSLSSKALGMEVAIADMEFHDFTEQHEAVGMPAISYYLTHAVLEGMAEDIAGVEFGHGRFEGLVNSIKRWTGGGAS